MSDNKILDQMINNINSPIYGSQWTLSDVTEGAKDIQYKVRGIDPPSLFPSFETESLSTGQPYYSKVVFDPEWSITLEEEIGMPVFEYLQQWKEQIFNPETLTFRLGSAYKKNFQLILYAGNKINPDQLQALYTSRMINAATNAGNIVLSSAVNRLTQKCNELLNGAMNNAGAGVIPLLSLEEFITRSTGGVLADLVDLGLDSILKNLNIHDSDVVALILNLNGVLLKGVEKLSLSYDSTEAIQWKVNLTSSSVSGTYFTLEKEVSFTVY